MLDVSELTEILQQTIRDLEARFENKVKEDFPSGNITVEDLSRIEGLKVLESDIFRYAEYLRDLGRKSREFFARRNSSSLRSTAETSRRPVSIRPGKHTDVSPNGLVYLHSTL